MTKGSREAGGSRLRGRIQKEISWIVQRFSEIEKFWSWKKLNIVQLPPDGGIPFAISLVGVQLTSEGICLGLG